MHQFSWSRTITESNSESISLATAELDLFVQSLFEETEAHPILAFVKRVLYQFNLHGTYDEAEILAEAYLRGRSAIERGVSIKNPRAWIARTSLNIIRENSREKHRNKKLLGKNSHEYWLPTNEDMPYPDHANQRLTEAMRQLSESDRQILKMRIADELSWQSIQEKISKESTEAISLASLRKRGQRALLRLRRAYSNIKSYTDD